MSKFYLGKTSRRRLKTCHPVIRKIINMAIATSPIDFGVVCGGRGRMAQDRVFYNGKSNARWGGSDHNFMQGSKLCSLAVDLAPYCQIKKDYIWDDIDLWIKLSNHIFSVALKQFGHKIEWGGNYRSIKDCPHFSLRF